MTMRASRSEAAADLAELQRVIEEFELPRPGLDPYPYYAEMRRTEPVSRTNSVLATAAGTAIGGSGSAGQVGNTYSIFSYDAVTQALKDWETFSNSSYADTVGRAMGRNILMMDPPEHARYRKLLQAPFSRGAMARWRDDVVKAANEEYIDSFVAEGSADLMRQMCLTFPVSIIHRVLGLPREEFVQFHRWAIELLQVEAHPQVAMAAAGGLAEYLTAIVAERRAKPGNDVVSILAEAQIDGVRLTDEEIISFLRVLLPAGGETTTRAIGSLLVALLRSPDNYRRVCSDRSLVPQAIEEVLRWEAPVTTVYRRCLRDTVLEGVEIPAGASVNVVLGSANRDELKYESPDQFDLDRSDKAPHMTFAYGPHLCIGMHLAKLEIEVAITALLDRLPNLRLDPDAPEPEITGITFRSPTAIPALWDVA
jgi:cytochrome P450